MSILNKGYRRYLRVEGSGHFVIDENQVKAEERYDGICGSTRRWVNMRFGVRNRFQFSVTLAS